MKAGRSLTLAVVCLIASACYHQVVQTGRTPGTTVIDRPWTATWIFGLVPATPIDVTQQCRTGVATVETQRSFANGLVGLLTLGIYTPVSVKVTCASGSASLGMPEIRIARNATPVERVEALRTAAEESLRLGVPVVIRF